MIVGGGSLNQLGSLLKVQGLRRPLVVSDAHLERIGLVDRVRGLLEKHEIAHEVFTDTISDPDTDSVERCRRALERGSHDSVVAVGGGSPMDTAKAANALYVNKGKKMRDLKAPFMLDEPALPMVAAPTSSGTGSECTKFTIITDSETNEKMLCIGLAYLPDFAIVDYELTMSKPYRLTADSGIDALCHAMEAYVSSKRNLFSSSLALAGLSKISHNLRKVCENPDDRAAREAMMLASSEAGMAFSNSSVTLIHGMSRPIGAEFHVPHGLSNAMLAPHLTKFSVEGALKEYADVSRSMDMCEIGVSDEDAAENLIKGLFSLTRDLQVPSLKDWGIDEAVFMEKVPRMAAAALASGSPNNNPIIPSEEQVKSLYKEIFLNA